MQSCAEKLSKIRKKAAISFTKEIKAGLEDLNFLDVQLEMRFLQEAKMSALGMDDAEFFISVNPGEPPKPLGTTVSGGELSRILLAIKTVLADKEDTPTLIFDEIDSGISGITAGKVAEKLHIIGQKRQVICITHLPQIAAAADAHYLIQKQTDQTTTKTGIFPLDEDASVGELARLLGGAQVTKNILDSAKEMKEMAKRTAVVALAGVMSVGMLTGCGSKTLDGTKTVATVDGTDIPLGVVSLYAREQQQRTTAMYMSYMGSADNIWDQTADEDSGETYGDQAVTSSLESIEKMYILKEKASDYNVEFTDEDETAIADAASQFMAANSEETIKELAVTEDQVKTLLELQTIQKKMYDPIVAEGNITVSDDEANQTTFTYVSISTSGDDVTDEDKETKKEQAQEILDKMKEDPTADMSEVAQGVDESYSAVQGNFTTKESEDEDEDSSGAAYPDEVISVLRGLKDGEVADDIIETDTGYYVVRLDKINDKDATASKRESLQNSKESTYYTETTNQWLDDADVKVVKKVLKTLKITDKHTFTAPTSTPTPSPEVTEEATPTPEADVTEEAEATETPAAEDTEATVTPTEEAEATETPEATPTEAAE